MAPMVFHDIFKLNICSMFFFVIKIIHLGVSKPAGIGLRVKLALVRLIKDQAKNIFSY